MIAALGSVITPASSSSSSSGSAGNSSSPNTGTDHLANEQTFLQLLVAQLQNQDPLQPADGLQFVSELAEFSSLEQAVQMRQDLDSINSDLSAASVTPPSSPSTATPPSTNP